MDNDGTSEEDTVKAKGFCTCKRDFPQRRSFHPPANATWHYLCDKPVLPPPGDEQYRIDLARGVLDYMPVGTGWPVSPAERTWYVVIPFMSEESARRALPAIEEASGYLGHVTDAAEDDPPEPGPDDAEAQRIAEVYADAADDQARIEAEARDGVQ